MDTENYPAHLVVCTLILDRNRHRKLPSTPSCSYHDTGQKWTQKTTQHTWLFVPWYWTEIDTENYPAHLVVCTRIPDRNRYRKAPNTPSCILTQDRNREKYAAHLVSQRRMAPKSSLCLMTRPMAWLTARVACCRYHCCPDRLWKHRDQCECQTENKDQWWVSDSENRGISGECQTKNTGINNSECQTLKTKGINGECQTENTGITGECQTENTRTMVIDFQTENTLTNGDCQTLKTQGSLVNVRLWKHREQWWVSDWKHKDQWWLTIRLWKHKDQLWLTVTLKTQRPMVIDCQTLKTC